MKFDLGFLSIFVNPNLVIFFFFIPIVDSKKERRSFVAGVDLGSTISHRIRTVAFGEIPVIDRAPINRFVVVT